MKNLGVLSLFLASLLAFGAALDAQATQRPRIQPGLAQPAALEQTAARKTKPDGGTREEDEEELHPGTPVEATAVLQLLDPGLLDQLAKLRLATKSIAHR